MKRTSKKEVYADTSRHQHSSIATQSSLKIPVPRENTLTTFRREKPVVQLPKILPICPQSRHRRYLESCYTQNDTSLRLFGTKYEKRGSRQQPHLDNTEAGQFKKGRSLLQKQESHKHCFLEQMLALNNIGNFYFQGREKIKVFVDEGNNSRLVKQLMRRRANLKLVSLKQDAQVIWTQFCDWETACKSSRFTQLDRKIRQPCNYQPFAEKRIEDWEVDKSLPKVQKRRDLLIQELKIHNHFKNHFQISDKKCLFKNIKRWCRQEKINEQEIIPKTYHVECSDSLIPQDICQTQKVWIVKPGEDTNRGTGITVQEGRDNIVSAVRELSRYGKSSLIQQYIDPLLYKNRKFDIRCYCLVTSVCGSLKAYWYQEGYLRTCSKEFSYDPSNIYGHLTNDAIQKKHKDYGKYEPYNKLSFSELEVFLKSKEISFADTVARMKELALMSIKAAEDHLKCDKNNICFEIFGYDFLIDSKGKVWLIEINTNPCLEFSGSLLSRIIWHMVENSLAIAVDPLLMNLPEQYNSFRERNDKIFEDNKFQCIF